MVFCLAKRFEVQLQVRDENGVWADVDTRPYQGLIIMNLPTYAGGRPIWGHISPNRKPGKLGKLKGKLRSRSAEPKGVLPRVDDGLLEVVGVRSAFHLGCMMAKWRRGVRIAQASEIRLRSAAGVFAQIDGEPWLESSGSAYHIRRIPPASIVAANQTRDATV